MRSRHASLVVGLVVSCAPAPVAPVAPVASVAPTSKAKPMSAPTFADDVAYLAKHGDVIVLEAEGGGRVAVSPTYQARVMTSAIAPTSPGLGWINRAFIDAGKTGTAFDNYGGEDRFWLGPEGGQFGLYFPPGSPFTFDAWQTPAAFQEGAWAPTFARRDAAGFSRPMRVTSQSGTVFSLVVDRQIRALPARDVEARLGIAVPAGVSLVAFESENRVTSADTREWTAERGLVSIWILGMFAPAHDARVVVPFEPGPVSARGAVVNDAYFGKVPPERLAVHEGEREAFLVFTCDGGQRGKIGLGPARAKSVAGSYSPSARLLTIVHYDKPPTETRYVNSMWETQKTPFAGDVINAYNDGPTAPGKPSLGGFYELETSSPAAALKPGASITHTHRTFHFVGDAAALEPIARGVLGVSLATIAAR